MEQINYQETFSSIVSVFTADPEHVFTEAELTGLEQLIEKFPFSQPLRLMYAAGLGTDKTRQQQYLPQAAAHAPQREVLYSIIHNRFSPVLQAEAANEVYTTGPSMPPPAHYAVVTEEVIFTEAPQDAVSSFTEPAEEQPETAKSNDAGTARDTEAEKLILGNITGTDFFAFEKSAADPLQGEEAAAGQQHAAPGGTAAKNEDTSSDVSKYDDDKMPYTFLWWLNKTRMEHAATYQPYASFSLDTTQEIKKPAPAAELEHQIIENIFHYQSPLEENAAGNTVEFEIKRKEDVIIEKFIKEEPQIKPPQPEKIDMENKARKSAEDANDLVSETLAQIYIDQMLYYKAIDTYKKLSLKFPEKSTYFADQILELEKKIN